MKKAIALILSLMMAAACAVPVFANSTNTAVSSQSTTLNRKSGNPVLDIFNLYAAYDLYFVNARKDVSTAKDKTKHELSLQGILTQEASTLVDVCDVFGKLGYRPRYQQIEKITNDIYGINDTYSASQKSGNKALDAWNLYVAYDLYFAHAEKDMSTAAAKTKEELSRMNILSSEASTLVDICDTLAKQGYRTPYERAKKITYKLFYGTDEF